jgi:hypothetical protein
MNVRHHQGYGHGLRPGTSKDINCPSCIREDDPLRVASPGQARWYALAVIGRDVDGGTETNEVSNYYENQRRPQRADFRQPGWQVLEFTVRAVNR